MWKFKNGVKFKGHRQSVEQYIFLVNKDIVDVCKDFDIDHQKVKYYTRVEVK